MVDLHDELCDLNVLDQLNDRLDKDMVVDIYDSFAVDVCNPSTAVCCHLRIDFLEESSWYEGQVMWTISRLVRHETLVTSFVFYIT